jgi:hypothetical protein
LSNSEPTCPTTCVFFSKKIAEDNNMAAAPIPQINNGRERECIIATCFNLECLVFMVASVRISY